MLDTTIKMREAILEANAVLPPWQDRVAPFRSYWNGLTSRRACGYYWRGTVHVEPALCAVPGRGYSWPGASSDRTLIGVYAHEIGHHVSSALRPSTRALIALGGPRVSSYEPNSEEAFAETFRVFCTNPALLRAGRPLRFEWMVDEVGLRWPGKLRRDWRDGLARGAPARYVAMCEKWVARH